MKLSGTETIYYVNESDTVRYRVVVYPNNYSNIFREVWNDKKVFWEEKDHVGGKEGWKIWMDKNPELVEEILSYIPVKK